ncbi:hypothetical protein CK203_059775 [Vitis vinifera]|uniref:Uncharacterized protein n=1 Tax=Vitis vinifera TaxID=29760 RepID=A0A438FSH8_VITVI|nr:hypothetical protein CK203_059775 [Vitis vinifera]
MDSQIVTIDQFAAAMASIQEAMANLGQRIDGQQTQQIEVAPPPVTLPIPTSEDPHTRMDRLLAEVETDEGFRRSYYLGGFRWSTSGQSAGQIQDARD